MLEIFSSKKRVWRAVRKGTVMAFANASIIMLIATVAAVCVDYCGDYGGKPAGVFRRLPRGTF